MRGPSERVYRAVFAVVFVLLGAVVGHGVTVMMMPTPPACEDMAEHALDAFRLWSKATGAVRERGDATDPDAYAVLDGKVNHLMASLEAIAPKYDRAAADCVGAS